MIQPETCDLRRIQFIVADDDKAIQANDEMVMRYLPSQGEGDLNWVLIVNGETELQRWNCNYIKRIVWGA